MSHATLDVREKLVHLVKNALRAYGKDLEKVAEPYEFIADFLIHNGVTVQEWISVKDRLPDLIPHSAGIAYSETVIVLTSGRKEMIAVWGGVDWIAQFDYCELWGEKITHWMPMPQPPKGE